jgi:hypothetical protein
MIVTVQFLQMGELLPEQPVTCTLEDMIPGPSPLISTAPEPPASASYHPSGKSIHWSIASHSNAVLVRSPNPAGNCYFKCKSPSMRVESWGKTPQQVPKYSILYPSACAYLTKLRVGSAILKTPHSSAILSIISRSRPLEWAQPSVIGISGNSSQARQKTSAKSSGSGLTDDIAVPATDMSPVITTVVGLMCRMSSSARSSPHILPKSRPTHTCGKILIPASEIA